MFAGVFMVVMLSSIGLPGLNGFVGEFLVLIGTFVTAPLVGRRGHRRRDPGRRLPAVGLPAGLPRQARGRANATFPEMTMRERAIMAPLIVLIVFLGVYPKPVLDRIEPSVDELIDHVERPLRLRASRRAAEPGRRRGRGGH